MVPESIKKESGVLAAPLTLEHCNRTGEAAEEWASLNEHLVSLTLPNPQKELLVINTAITLRRAMTQFNRL